MKYTINNSNCVLGKVGRACTFDGEIKCDCDVVYLHQRYRDFYRTWKFRCTDIGEKYPT